MEQPRIRRGGAKNASRKRGRSSEPFQSTEKKQKKQKKQMKVEPHQPVSKKEVSKQKASKGSKASSSSSSSSSLQAKLRAKLEGGQFRFLNETLYTSSSDAAVNLFKKEPKLYDVYHRGFEEQTKKWPQNPVEVIVRMVQRMPPAYVIGDFGCGNALLARSVSQKVHSFDLCKTNEFVTVANSADVPLKDASLDVAVFCLSLMGTDFHQFLLEARRVLRDSGTLIVAEVKSRFAREKNGDEDDEEKERAMLQGIAKFEKLLSLLGFKLIQREMANKMFVLHTFSKRRLERAEEERLRKDADTLRDKSGFAFKSCRYKKR